jgi:hypothetical protein
MRALASLSLVTILALFAACDDPADPPKESDDAAAQSVHASSEAGAVAEAGVVSDAGATGTVAADAGSSTTPAACNLACIRGKHCVVGSTGPSCVDDTVPAEAGTCAGPCPGPGASCAATSCPTGTYCDDISGSAQCLPAPSCNTVKCTATTRCELVAVQCIRAPCPAQAQCVDNAPRACNLLCVQGKHCVVSDSGPSCVSNDDAGVGADAGVACGKRSCDVGQKCCSASCGICGSAAGACPAIACVPEP